MTKNRTAPPVLLLLRAAVPSVLVFIGLTTVIIGILAMHVWMGGHGSTSHHVAAPTTTSTYAVDETDHGHADRHAKTATAVVTAVTTVGVTALDAASQTASNIGSDSVLDGGLVGCGGDCADEMMLGMCVMAMIAVGIAGLLTPAGPAVLSALGRRGPPALSWMSRPAPAPSLTQLCISRT